MEYERILLPAASVVELVGILTLLTNESFVGPIDIGFSVPYLVSPNLQGLALILAGSALTLYSLSQLS